MGNHNDSHKQTNGKQNSLLIKDGNYLELVGVLRVDDFDKEEINLDTNLGPLTIKGRELHIAQLLLENEELAWRVKLPACALRSPNPKSKATFLNG